MKKRQLAIIPLLFACIVMLATTLLPHHHHGESICFAVTHCVDPEEAATCQDDHDSNSCKDTCEIKLLFEAGIIKENHSICSCCPGQLLLPLFIIAEKYDLILPPGDSRVFPPSFYRECLHPVTWSVTTAGRAPPVIA